MSQVMPSHTTESYWDQQKNGLKKVRQQLLSGDKKSIRNKRRSPAGRHSRTPPAQLPRLNGPRKTTSPSLRGQRYGPVPPVQSTQTRPEPPSQPSGYDSWEEGGDSDDEGPPYPSNPYPVGNPYPGYAYPVYVPQPVYYPGQPIPVMYPQSQPQMSQSMGSRRGNKKKVRYKNTPTYMDEMQRMSQRQPYNSLYRTPEHPILTPPQFSYISPQSYVFQPVYSQPRRLVSQEALDHLDDDPTFAQEVVEIFIHNSLEESIVPDLLIDVLSEFTDSAPDPADASRDVLSLIVQEGVNDLVREVVAEASTELTDSYLDEKASQTDPLQDFVMELVEEVVYSGATYVAREAVQDLAEVHLDEAVLRRAVGDIIEEHLHDQGPDIVRDSILDVMLEDIIDEMAEPDIAETCQEVALEVLQHEDQRKQKRQLKEILNHAGDRLVDGFCLDHLLSLVSRQTLPWTQSDLPSGAMDSLMLDVLLGQLFHVEATRKATIDDKPLRRLHEKMAADVAEDVLIAELCRSLDEDMLDLDEYEQGYDLPDHGASARIPTRINNWLTGL